MQQTLRFALFGNTYQEHKSAHVTHLLEILRRRKAQICISNEFYDFLRNHTKADLSGLEVFEGNNFSADMVLSIGGDGTFLKAASRSGKRNSDIRNQYRQTGIPGRRPARPDGRCLRRNLPRQLSGRTTKSLEAYMQWACTQRISIWS